MCNMGVFLFCAAKQTNHFCVFEPDRHDELQSKLGVGCYLLFQKSLKVNASETKFIIPKLLLYTSYLN